MHLNLGMKGNRLRFWLFLGTVWSLTLIGDPGLFAQNPDLDRYISPGKRKEGNRAGAARKRLDPKDSGIGLMQELHTGIYWYEYPKDPTNLVQLPPYLVLNGFNYVPRYAFWSSGDHVSLSIGSNVGFALQLSNFGSVFMLNIPVNMELNIGRGSKVDNEDPVGAFAGFGLEYNFVNDFIPRVVVAPNGDYVESVSNLSQVGFQWTAGARLRIAGRPYSLRYTRSLFMPTQKVMVNHFGFGVSLF